MKLKTIMLAAIAAAFAGCVETAGTRVSIDTRTGDASVLESSTRLANRVRVVGVSYDDVSGIKKATVTLESLSHKRQELQARMVWMDADGAEVDADGKPFRAIVLDGMDVTTFTGMAPNPKCVKARLQLRETDTAQ
ncbi:MAG: DUF1425 domain-containing protein [Kiritimatiellae bacterium]|jgi:uncharacterized protein YcfL|nr:DUF1425 domain-containing protein [Kiritimatiellia bacterium]MBR4476707.1 DUF1425 domain-containing protein [Kiritimatiellia bacterium]